MHDLYVLRNTSKDIQYYNLHLFSQVTRKANILYFIETLPVLLRIISNYYFCASY